MRNATALAITTIGMSLLMTVHARAQLRAGDCNGDGEVTANEILLGAEIATGLMLLDRCPMLDADENGGVEREDLRVALCNVFGSCAGSTGRSALLAAEDSPLLDVNAVANEDPSGPGELITYTFTFANRGGPASGVFLQATTPLGTTYVSANPVPGSAPGPGGTGGVTWTIADLDEGEGGVATMTVHVDAGLPDGGQVVLSGYGIESAELGLVTGPTVTTGLRSERPLAVVKIDAPDGVTAGSLLTYVLTVSNRGEGALEGVVVQESFDSNLTIVSLDPLPDAGSTDRWTIPFLPVGGTRTITIEALVDNSLPPGTILRNFASVTDAEGRTAQTNETSTVVAAQVLALSITDLPDPVQPSEPPKKKKGGEEGELTEPVIHEVTYTLSYANSGDAPLSGVVVHATIDPRVTLVSADPAPDGGSHLSWTIGDLPEATSGSIVATFAVNTPKDSPPVTNGALLTVRAWVDDGGGHVASASEVTLALENPEFRQYTLSVTGAPRNLRLGTVTQLSYDITVRNIGLVDTTNATISNLLPAGVKLLRSLPPATTTEGRLLTYVLPVFAAGNTERIRIEAELLPATPAGASLFNLATVTDEEGNSAEASFLGGVREGPTMAAGDLSVTLTTLRRVVAGSKIKSTIAINNSGRGIAENVMLVVEGPPELQLVTALPAPSSIETSGGRTRLKWTFATIPGPGKQTVALTQKVPGDVPAGTSLSLIANVTAAGGVSDEASALVAVRD